MIIIPKGTTTQVMVPLMVDLAVGNAPVQTLLDASTDEDKVSTVIRSVLTPLSAGVRSYGVDEIGVSFDPRGTTTIPQTSHVKGQIKGANEAIVRDTFTRKKAVTLQENFQSKSFWQRNIVGKGMSDPHYNKMGVDVTQKVKFTLPGFKTGTVIIPASAADIKLNKGLAGDNLTFRRVAKQGVVSQPGLVDTVKAKLDNSKLRKSQRVAAREGLRGTDAAERMRKMLPERLQARVQVAPSTVGGKKSPKATIQGGELKAKTTTTTTGRKSRWWGDTEQVNTKSSGPSKSWFKRGFRALPLIGTAFDVAEVIEEVAEGGIFSKGALAATGDLMLGLTPVGIVTDGIALATGQEGAVQALVGEGDD